MNYEMAVLAALVQLEKPSKPRITEKTGISDQRVNLAIKNIRDILGVRISRIGSNKTGFYAIDSWGVFETGRKILRRAQALDLDNYKKDRTFKYDSYRLKKLYSDEVKLANYRQSLKLEGFRSSESSPDLDRLSRCERQQRREALVEKFTRHGTSPVVSA